MKFDPEGTEESFRNLAMETTNGATCDQETLNVCISDFTRDIGLPSPIPLHSRDMTHYLDALYRNKGRSGFQKVCQAAYLLKTCVSDMADSCLSIPSLIRNVHMEPKVAAMYVGMAKQLVYQCGEAHDYILSYWECLNRDSYQNEIDRCMDENILEACQYRRFFLRCQTGVISRHCGKIAGRIACETLQKGLVATVAPPCGALVCPASLYVQNHDLSKSIKLTEPEQERPEHKGPLLPKKFHVPELHAEEDYRPHHHGHCNKTVFSRCARAYFKNLGVKVPRNATDFVADLGKLMEKEGKAGFTKLCRAGHTLGACLGRERRACFNVRNLMDFGLSKRDALIYHTIAQTLGYECGPAYKVLMDKYDCVKKTAVSANATEIGCVQDFQKRIKEHPDRTCMYLQQLVNCAIAPFSKACGKDLGHVLCVVEKISLHVSLPKCHVRCRRHAHPEPEPRTTRVPQPVLPTQQSNLTPKTLHVISSQHHRALDRLPLDSECPTTLYNKCVSQLQTGLHMDPLPKDPMEFIRKIDQRLRAQGKSGFKDFCRAVSAFKKCLGSSEQACISVAHLRELGVTKENAIIWVAVYAQLQDECGPDYKTIYDNFDCIERVGVQYNHTIMHCAEDFERFVKHDPEHACHFAQEFISCLSKPYKDHCSPAVGGAICNAERVALDTIWSHCPLTCNPHHTHSFLPKTSVYRTEEEEELNREESSEQTLLSNTCRESAFNDAVSSLARKMGLTSIPKDAHDFAAHVHRWLMKSDLVEIRFDTLCTGIREFAETLGGSEDNCVSTEFLMRQGVTRPNALNFITMHKEYLYQCGPAYNAYKENLHCLMYTSEHFRPILTTCADTFNSKMSGARSTVACQNAQEFLRCWTEPFQRSCKQEATQAVCNTIKIGIEDRFDKCPVSC